MLINHYYKLRKSIVDLEPIAWTLSKRELNQLYAKKGVDQIVEAAFSYRGRGHYTRINPVQDPSELMEAAKMIQSKQPAGVLEIGTRNGGTLFTWCRVSSSTQKFISVDLPPDGKHKNVSYHPKRKKLYKEFIADYPHSEMTLIFGDSQRLAT